MEACPPPKQVSWLKFSLHALSPHLFPDDPLFSTTNFPRFLAEIKQTPLAAFKMGFQQTAN